MTGIYFSGTGNTRHCIAIFMKCCGEENKVYSIEDKNAVNAISRDNEIILAYPVYYSNMPKIVSDFIKNNHSLWAGKNIFIIATMGLFSGDGAGVSARLLTKYGAKIKGGLHIKMPDCIGDVKALKKSPEENREIIAAAESKLIKAAEFYKKGDYPAEGLGFLSHMAGLFGQRLYFFGKTREYKSMPKIDGRKCTGCGKCAKSCPMGNITVREGKAVGGNMCTLCYRCFSHCPKQAVTILGKRVICQYKMDM